MSSICPQSFQYYQYSTEIKEGNAFRFGHREFMLSSGNKYKTGWLKFCREYSHLISFILSSIIWNERESLCAAGFAINVWKSNEKCILVLPIGNMKCHRFFASCMKKIIHWFHIISMEILWGAFIFAFNKSNVKVLLGFYWTMMSPKFSGPMDQND